MENKDRVTHHIDHYEGHRSKRLDQRRYADGADVCIVGAGAAGGVLAYELAKAGLRVVVIEAGPFWNPQTDFASDELAMKNLGWQETRLVDGNNPLRLGHNNSGRGVGGGTVHFTGVFLRFHESDFMTKTVDGVGEDWPIRYQDLAPYYDKIEREIAVSGPDYFPWGPFNGPYPFPVREPISANSQLFREACAKLGFDSVVAPLAILSAPFDGRPPCINRGFCNQGCMPNAKYSGLIHHIPKAIQAGAEVLSDCMVTQILTDGTRVTGVLFQHGNDTYKQTARVVILAGYVVETPRLLLNSATPHFPDGLANSSGWVGKAIMTHSSQDVYGLLPEEVRLYKGTPVLALTQHFYETDRNRGFARGYTLSAHGARPVAMAGGIAAERMDGTLLWGKALRETMLDYNYYARITLVGEVLPNPDNAVTLSDEKDEYGLPIPKVTFSYGENDKKLIAHAIEQMKRLIEAMGGTPQHVVDDTAHLMGGCRMGKDPSTSVVNEFGQTHDIPNLFIAGASTFVTSGGANPTNTVMALAARTADRLVEAMKTRDV
ncbi:MULTISPECIES: GMC family oxidoreductase [Brevibacillus]|jgi:choline dehydrogenase-like flavoprotein|uniref:Oxidoreductase n=1 Tax=Brevibacillus aydinogluensis TaxID=927786 RepID=A0AA48MAJ1_9BACL|nr:MULTISPECIES: GMC family oxidoreductase [Bacillales]REK60927.1 MAG: GMC family oxidoreductase [Brevibacillus sp.]MBR8661528.1 GMC family oxidoreductase [Brevibacillus sp. NL20B1]MDT3417881.1 choline dehydrogenase-like flavoprotein [Brevibacillus aydinogluensis]UFJ62570.1 GMC family oxidoreductase [Anoxybacillus sediminis]CAJ1004312.1 Oxidoreductase [Brevibacillus aydinogluensis]